MRQADDPPGGDPAHGVVVQRDGVTVGRFSIGPAGLVVGRSAPADIVLDAPVVSRRHCQMEVRAGGVWIRDLGSTNGTFVNGTRLTGAVAIVPGGRIGIGPFILEYACDAPAATAPTQTQTQTQTLASEPPASDRDIQRASDYITALLPAPLRDGPVLADHRYHPCARLGGDTLGYRLLSPTLAAGYLLDVAGHGVGPAMHAVTLATALRPDTRQPGGLLGVDFGRPADVLGRLNDHFAMARHGGLCFSMWYWAYDATTRVLEFCAGGHHAGYLMAPDRSAMVKLAAPNPAVGVTEGMIFKSERVRVRPGCVLYLFSDGAFDIIEPGGRRWGLDDFLPLLRAPMVPGMAEPRRLFDAVCDAAGPGPLDDDFAAVVLTFP